ncbi:hypothetical protein D3C77_386390 [compost metagenome]
MHHLELLRRHLEVLLHLEHIRNGLLVLAVRVQFDEPIGALHLLHHLLAAHVGGVLVHDHPLGLQQPGELDAAQVHLILGRDRSGN